jgi:hypothetical protein
VCSLAAAAALTGSQAASAAGPHEVLAKLNPATSFTVVKLSGTLGPVPGIEWWRVLVNDAVIFESPHGSASRSEVPLELGLTLRPGGNLIAIEAHATPSPALTPPRGTLLRRWSTHVFRQPATTTQKFAVIAQGDDGRTNSEHANTVKAALARHGVPDANIRTATSWEKVVDSLGDIGAQATPRDQVFIYYTGKGRLAQLSTEPELVFSKDRDTVRVGDLVLGAGDLPSVSVLLDIDYQPSSFVSLRRTLRSSAQQAVPVTTASWLRTLGAASRVELAYTNPLIGASGSDADGFTKDFFEMLPDAPDVCGTFADIAQKVASVNAGKTASAWPVYYSAAKTDSSSFRFCTPRTSAISVSKAQTIDAQEPRQFVDVAIPDGTAAPAEIRVDGVPVPRQTVKPTSPDGNKADAGSKSAVNRIVRVALGAGGHVIEFMDRSGPAATPTVRGVAAAAPVELGQGRYLVATVQGKSASASLTSDGSMPVSFIVGDRKNHPLSYEVRNNGVVVLQSTIDKPTQLARTELLREIPLLVGTNNIVLDVVQGVELASASFTVVRRPAQPIRALIVGADGPADSSRLSASKDAGLMYRTVLQFTDAVPGRVKLLTGSAATHDAVLKAIDELKALPHGSDDTFLLYIAGFGYTFEQNGVVRCLLPSDFDSQRPRETCLSTAELDERLLSVGRALIVVDASYDGLAGEHSRTYRTYTGDADWRFMSGIEQPDRAFLVASGSNSAALETEEGGVFTRSFAKVLRQQLEAPPRGDLPREIGLLDAFERVREETSKSTDRQQTPVMKGVLSSPFTFVYKTMPELKAEALGIERSARSGATAMRVVDAERLEWARVLFDKVLALDDRDGEAHLGRARVLALLDRVDDAKAVTDATLTTAPNDSGGRAEWLVLRGELKLRSGDILGAIADVSRANVLVPRQRRTMTLLGMLYGANGEHSMGQQILDEVLTEDGSNTILGGELTDEELGQAVLHCYLNLRKWKGKSNGKVMLESFSDTYKGKGRFEKTFYRIRAVQRFMPHRSNAVAAGGVDVESPWFHLVAQFLRSGKKYEDDLINFKSNVQDDSPREDAAFNCQLHFYLGMAYLFNHDPKSARSEFRQVEESKKTSTVEFWFARQQVKGLTQ